MAGRLSPCRRLYSSAIRGPARLLTSGSMPCSSQSWRKDCGKDRPVAAGAGVAAADDDDDDVAATRQPADGPAWRFGLRLRLLLRLLLLSLRRWGGGRGGGAGAAAAAGEAAPPPRVSRPPALPRHGTPPSQPLRMASHAPGLPRHPSTPLAAALHLPPCTPPSDPSMQLAWFILHVYYSTAARSGAEEQRRRAALRRRAARQ